LVVVDSVKGFGKGGNEETWRGREGSKTPSREETILLDLKVMEENVARESNCGQVVIDEYL
jgi:hypothetical protein